MPFALGVSILACVVAVGLAHLAVRGTKAEHAIGMAAAVAVAIPLLLVSAAAGALLLFVTAGTRRLTHRRVPDRVPTAWAEGY